MEVNVLFIAWAPVVEKAWFYTLPESSYLIALEVTGPPGHLHAGGDQPTCRSHVGPVVGWISTGCEGLPPFYSFLRGANLLMKVVPIVVGLTKDYDMQ